MADQSSNQDAEIITDNPKLRVEIWSDVMCPFCYIGKRKLEQALQKFPRADRVAITWKSFQLNPNMKTNPAQSLNEYLAATKGWTLDYTRQLHQRVTQMAKDVGLEYDFDRAVVANSFDAHRLVQLAKAQGLGDAMEEGLFKAYFTEGKNTADHPTLKALGVAAGLGGKAIDEVLSGDAYAQAVREDVREAREIGVTGVPFFVFDRKYAVSGAQDSRVFLDVLEKSFAGE